MRRATFQARRVAPFAELIAESGGAERLAILRCQERQVCSRVSNVPTRVYHLDVVLWRFVSRETLRRRAWVIGGNLSERNTRMGVDLGLKISRLIGDFKAVLYLIDTIEHELEKRIIARTGLIKLEALISIVGAYKNQRKLSTPAPNPTLISSIEDKIRNLRKDIDGAVRPIRNAMVGHLIAIDAGLVPEYWLFTGNSTYQILLADLEALEDDFSVLDSAYIRAPAAPPFNQKFFRNYWRTAPRLGDPSIAREANIQVGLWTPDIVLPAGVEATSDPASIRVLGHRLSIRQLGLILEPF